MAGDEVVWFEFKKGRLILFAAFFDLLAPRIETASPGRIDRADDIALQNDLLRLKLRVG